MVSPDFRYGVPGFRVKYYPASLILLFDIYTPLAGGQLLHQAALLGLQGVLLGFEEADFMIAVVEENGGYDHLLVYLWQQEPHGGQITIINAHPHSAIAGSLHKFGPFQSTAVVVQKVRV